jgi:hypothetical protein
MITLFEKFKQEDFLAFKEKEIAKSNVKQIWQKENGKICQRW